MQASSSPGATGARLGQPNRGSNHLRGAPPPAPFPARPPWPQAAGHCQDIREVCPRAPPVHAIRAHGAQGRRLRDCPYAGLTAVVPPPISPPLPPSGGCVLFFRRAGRRRASDFFCVLGVGHRPTSPARLKNPGLHGALLGVCVMWRSWHRGRPPGLTRNDRLAGSPLRAPVGRPLGLTG